MADPQQTSLSAAEAESLLAGIDAAFEQVVHGRFGGGIDVSMLEAADEEAVQVLRMPGAGQGDRLRLLLQKPAARNAPDTGRGVIVGTVKLSKPPSASIDEIFIVTEIFDHRDVNEAADATYFGTGLVFAPMPSQSAAPGLAVVRSSQAAASADRQDTRQQRGWLPQQRRNTPSRALGLGSNGHRRSPDAGTSLPVSGDLLARVGQVVAGIGAANPALSVGAVVLVVETSPGGMG